MSTRSQRPFDASSPDYWDRFEVFNNENKMFSDWVTIACRNGAVALYSYWMAIQAISALLSKSPVLKSQVNQAEKNYATGIFTKTFADVSAVRNSALHPGELSATPSEMAKHEVIDQAYHPLFGDKPAGGRIFLAECVQLGDDFAIYSTTFRGRFVEYSLSSQSLDKLQLSKAAYFKAFLPTESSEQQIFRQWMEDSAN